MVAALAQIEQTGLSLQQIKNVGSGLISYLEEAKRVCSPSPRRQALGSFASRFQATTSSRRLLVRKPFSQSSGLLPSLILGMPPGTFVTLEVVLDRHVPLGMPPGTFVTLGMTLIIQRGNS
jgi:hypothetical protein